MAFDALSRRELNRDAVAAIKGSAFLALGYLGWFVRPWVCS
jgi:uncharacterized membrane protein